MKKMSVKPEIWAIEKCFSFEELIVQLDEYNDVYTGRVVVSNESGDRYRIGHFGVLNYNGKAEYAVNYYPYSPVQERDLCKIRHIKPAKEFFDGRFRWLFVKVGEKMKKVHVNRNAMITEGCLKYQVGKVVGYDGEIDEVEIKLDESTFVKIKSDYIEQGMFEK